MSDLLEEYQRLARAHTEAAMEGKVQELDFDLAEYMGAYIEEALSPSDAIDSIFDGEMVHG